MNILGISAYYHDSAACLIRDGEIIAAAQEERFTRKKHDDGFPRHAVAYCLQAGGVEPGVIDAVAFYDKPLTKFGRIMETYRSTAPGGVQSFLKAIPVWFSHKLWIPGEIEEELAALGYEVPDDKLYFPEHHESHAASAFYPSPFQDAAILTLDGVGEWATSSLAIGRGNQLELVKELQFPHSLGLLYSAFTYFTGFRVNSGEYKLMGLAPYGEPIYKDLILEKLLDLKPDGSFQLNMEYFGYLTELRMTNDRFASLFGGAARAPESRITKREMDLARSIQVVTEEIVLTMARHVREETGLNNLCLAGGVALNCVANGKLLAERIFDGLWIQPAAGDAGGALGAALLAWHQVEGQPRQVDGKTDSMKGSYLGPAFDDDEIAQWLTAKGYPAQHLPDDKAWADRLSGLMSEGKVVGCLQGRMEFGPRALGNRSILGDPRSPKMQSVMNLKIKYRESFRPFAPSCLAETVSDYFDLRPDDESPYMLLVAPVQEARCLETGEHRDMENLIDWVNEPRSDLPAITHVDYSARVQTVDRERNPRYHELIRSFGEKSGIDVLINTSFNVRGEPIVCTPDDAYRCFMRTEMDVLSLGGHVLLKEDQPEWEEEGDWRHEFALD